MEMVIIGLGKMGKELALQALRKKIKVIGLTLGDVPSELITEGLTVAHDLEELMVLTTSPRKIFLYVPAGPIIEKYVQEFSVLLEQDDIVIDAGNSYWGDSVRRFEKLRDSGIHFLDVGTSGGISGAREGACFMVGGSPEAYEAVYPILLSLAAPQAVSYVGPSGSGHLVKLIHNGIEFGMLQAIGEGMALLERFKTIMNLDMEGVFQTYRHGSVIRSWLIDLMAQQYESKQGLRSVSSFVEDTGEVNWLIGDALHLEVPIPVISQSVMELFRSRDSEHNDYRSVALMRNGFGGHPFGPREELKFERLLGRVEAKFWEGRHDQ